MIDFSPLSILYIERILQMNEKKKALFLVVALVVLLGGGTIAYRALTQYTPDETERPVSVEEEATGPDENNASAEPRPATDFTVENEAGEKVRLSELQGRPVIVNFWATWCPPCRSELPLFDSYGKQYGDKITFLMVDLADGVQETKQTVHDFMEENGYTFDVHYDTSGEAVRAYQIRGIPMTIAVDAEGNLVSEQIGALSEDVLAGMVNDLS